jgi:hypothetical protein
MRSVLVAVVLGLSVLGARPAPAAPFTTALDGLKTELETRRDDDFGGTLDAARKKQQKAVLKSLALIDRPSAGAQDDLKTFGSVAGLLEKAYPAEMSPVAALPLRVLCEGADDDLQAIIDAEVAVLDGFHLRMVPSPTATKAEKFYKSGNAARGKDDPAGRLSKKAKNSLKGWKLLLKAIPFAQASMLLPAPNMNFVANGPSYLADTVSWKYHSKSRRIEISASSTDPGTGDSVTVTASGIVVQGVPTVTVDAGEFATHPSGGGGEVFAATGGSIAVNQLDVPGRRFVGSLDMDVSGSTAFKVLGIFSATWNLEIVQD